MEVRQILQSRIEPDGDVHLIIKSLDALCKRFSHFNRLCIERNPGYERGGWLELVGYRDETEQEIEARNKSELRQRKSAAKHIQKKEAEIKKLRKDFEKKFGME